MTNAEKAKAFDRIVEKRRETLKKLVPVVFKTNKDVEDLVIEDVLKHHANYKRMGMLN